MINIALRIAATGDSKEILKKAFRLLEKTNPRETGEDPRAYHARVMEIAKSGGGIFDVDTIDFIESLDATCFPKTGRFAFIDWLATAYQEATRKKSFTKENVTYVKDYYVGMGTDLSYIEGKSLEEAIAESEEWHSNSFTTDKKGYITPPEVNKVASYGDLSIFKTDNVLCTEEQIENDLNYEGGIMNICVGQIYASDVIDGSSVIYSLRDTSSPHKPHATMMASTSGKFQEIKGNSNADLSNSKYVIPMCKFLFDNFKFSDYGEFEDFWFIRRAPVELLQAVYNDQETFYKRRPGLNALLSEMITIRGGLEKGDKLEENPVLYTAPAKGKKPSKVFPSEIQEVLFTMADVNTKAKILKRDGRYLELMTEEPRASRLGLAILKKDPTIISGCDMQDLEGLLDNVINQEENLEARKLIAENMTPEMKMPDDFMKGFDEATVDILASRAVNYNWTDINLMEVPEEQLGKIVKATSSFLIKNRSEVDSGFIESYEIKIEEAMEYANEVTTQIMKDCIDDLRKSRGKKPLFKKSVDSFIEEEDTDDVDDDWMSGRDSESDW